MFDWITKRRAPRVASRLSSNYQMMPTGLGGFFAGTHVASNLGWRPVEALSVGDRVLTFDHGMQLITEMHRETFLVTEGAMDAAHSPMMVPKDALNNRAPMWVMPDQGILLESDLAIDAQGDPFVVVPACTLEGYRGIERAPVGQRLEIIVPRFARDEVIYLEAGLLGFSPTRSNILEMAGIEESLYRVLPPNEARELVSNIVAEEKFWSGDMTLGAARPDTQQFSSARH